MYVAGKKAGPWTGILDKQRGGESSMPQGVLPSKYEEEKSESSLTALAGLPLRLDLASVIGISDHIETHMHVRPARGWTDERVIITDDIRILEHDEGFSRISRRCELRGFPGRERRIVERRFRKERPH
jgi:hypothetical protein